MANFKSITAGLYLGIAAIGLSATPAAAILIDQGATTLDTDQNLVWLDVTESAGRSYNNVVGQFGAGGDFAGYRHATLTEVTNLITNAGLIPYQSYNPASPAEASTFLQLIHLFGPTRVDNDPGAISGERAQVVGLFDDLNPTNGFVGFGAISYDSQTFSTGQPSWGAIEVQADRHNVGPATNPGVNGHWLVRDPSSAVTIPEPTSIALLATGFIGIGIARRRRTQIKTA